MRMARVMIPAACLVMLAVQAAEAPALEARVMELNGKVSILKDLEKSVPAQIGDPVKGKDLVSTGKKSRAELELSDRSLVRLGANTVFSFEPSRRDLMIEQGEGLFVVPKGLEGTRVSTPAATAAIMGTTVYLKVTKEETDYYCLEGKCQIGPQVLESGDRIHIKGRNAYTAPVTQFKIGEWLKDHPLLDGFSRPLPSRDLIDEEIKKQ